MLKKLKIPPQKGAARQTQTAPSTYRKYSKATAHKSDSHVSGGAYQDARKVSLVWNAKLKHCFPPEFRGRMHQTRPSALFSPIFSRAREKIGPPEARQKRPRRNESLQARLLILCARFFLSKPQTEFAVWVLSQSCNNQSLSQPAADSSLYTREPLDRLRGPPLRRGLRPSWGWRGQRRGG